MVEPLEAWGSDSAWKSAKPRGPPPARTQSLKLPPASDFPWTPKKSSGSGFDETIEGSAPGVTIKGTPKASKLGLIKYASASEEMMLESLAASQFGRQVSVELLVKSLRRSVCRGVLLCKG